MKSGKQADPSQDYLVHFPYTERERDAMISLPRKECKLVFLWGFCVREMSLPCRCKNV